VSGTDAATTTSQLDATTAELERALRRLHLAVSDRRAIVAEVRADLEAAVADGMSPSALIGPDVETFAREAAEARGYRPRQSQYPRVALGGTLAAVVGAGAAYLLIVEFLVPLFASWFDLPGDYPVAGPVVAYAGMAVAAVLVTLLVLHRLLMGRTAARQTVRRAAVLVPLATAGGIAVAAAVGRSNDYSVGVAVVQAVLIVVPVALALVGARWWAVREARTRDGVPVPLP
jgi:hypothetical protein